MYTFSSHCFTEFCSCINVTLYLMKLSFSLCYTAHTVQKTYTYTVIRCDWYGPENRLSFHFRHKWSGMLSAKHIMKMPPNVSKDGYGCHAWTHSVMKQET